MVIPPAGAIWMSTISITGLSLLRLKHISRLLSILCYIKSSVIIIILADATAPLPYTPLFHQGD